MIRTTRIAALGMLSLGLLGCSEDNDNSMMAAPDGVRSAAGRPPPDSYRGPNNGIDPNAYKSGTTR